MVLNGLKALNICVALHPEEWTGGQLHFISRSSINGGDWDTKRKSPWWIAILPRHHQHHPQLPAGTEINAVNFPGFSRPRRNQGRPAARSEKAANHRSQRAIQPGTEGHVAASPEIKTFGSPRWSKSPIQRRSCRFPLSVPDLLAPSPWCHSWHKNATIGPKRQLFPRTRLSVLHPKIPRTTSPYTSVSRKSRPA